jgi:hypothetical protein
MPLSGITAVRPTPNTVASVPLLYGATIAAGVPVYLDATDSKHKATDANLSAVAAKAVGITITPGVDNGSGYIATGGSIILVGATMVVGETYYCGPTAGQIIATSELTTGDYVTRLGTAASTTQLDLSIKATGIVRA